MAYYMSHRMHRAASPRLSQGDPTSRQHTNMRRRTLTAAAATLAGCLTLTLTGCGTPNTPKTAHSTNTTLGATGGASKTPAKASPTFKPGAFPAWDVENRENPWTVETPVIPAAVKAKFDPGVPQQAYDAVVALTEKYLYVSAYAGVEPLPKRVLDEISKHLTAQAKQGFNRSARVATKPGVRSDKDYGNVAMFIADNDFGAGSQYRVVNGYVYGRRTIKNPRLTLDQYGEIEVAFTATTDLYYQCQGQPYTSTLTTEDKMLPIQDSGAWKIRWATGKWTWRPDPKARAMKNYPCATAPSPTPSASTTG